MPDIFRRAGVAQSVWCLGTDWTTGVRSSAEATDVSYSLCVQTTQPPVQWVPWVVYPGVKRSRGVTMTPHPHPVPRLGMSWSRSAASPPIDACTAVAGQLYFFSFSDIFHLAV
jgi:hypothetical protein